VQREQAIVTAPKQLYLAGVRVQIRQRLAKSEVNIPGPLNA
jgi:hypothetical protein